MEIPDMLASQLVSSLWPPIEMGVPFFLFWNYRKKLRFYVIDNVSDVARDFFEK